MTGSIVKRWRVSPRKQEIIKLICERLGCSEPEVFDLMFYALADKHTLINNEKDTTPKMKRKAKSKIRELLVDEATQRIIRREPQASKQ